MKPTLQFRLQQQLALTPQLQQAIKLLQLSSQELEAKLIEALETNPVLERTDFDEVATEAAEAGDTSEITGQDTDVNDLDVAREDLWEPSFEERGLTTDLSRSGKASDQDREIVDAPSETLAEHLNWQLGLTFHAPADLAIGSAIIDAIDDNGYLTETATQIQQTLGDDLGDQTDRIEAMILAMQQFDPVGVATANMRECLSLQLCLLEDGSPITRLATTLVDHHLEIVARGKLDLLCRQLDCSERQIQQAIDLIRSLEPRPGAAFSSEPVEYVRPDVVIERADDGIWRARLYEQSMPKIQISDFYRKLMEKTKGSDADYLRDQMTEARWLLRSLETRNDTIFRVANAIVDHQQAFFEHGPEQMKPLVLREIADAIEMHESTISRITTRKYMLTPRGIFEFKYFFSSHVGTADGGEASATAVQAMIRQLIDDEPPNKPLSDAKITTLLSGRGINVARRTVAKYREAMNIESSSKRRRLL